MVCTVYCAHTIPVNHVLFFFSFTRLLDGEQQIPPLSRIRTDEVHKMYYYAQYLKRDIIEHLFVRPPRVYILLLPTILFRLSLLVYTIHMIR